MSYFKVDSAKIEKKAVFNKELFFRVYSIIVILYLLAINNVSSEITGLIGILLSLPFLFFPESALPLLFICSINGEYMVALKGVGMARVFTLVFVVGALAKFLITKTKISHNDSIFYGLMCIYMFVSAAFSVTGELDAGFSMMLNVLTLFMMKYIKTDMKYLFDNIMIMSMIMTSYYFIIIFLDIGTYPPEALRVTIDEAVNPNNFAMAVVQLGAFHFAYMLYSKNRVKKFLLFICFSLSLVTSFVTGSRSSFVGIVGGVFCCILLALIVKNPQLKINKLLVLGSFIIGLVAFFIYVYSSDSSLVERFTFQSVVDSGGTGRIRIWETLLVNVLPKHFFFGVGVGGVNIAKEVEKYLLVAHGAHNIVISILLQFGIIGFIIFMLFLGYHLIKFIRNYKYDALIIVPFTMICTNIFNGIGEDTFSSRALWFTLGISLMICRENRKRLSEQQESNIYIKKKK